MAALALALTACGSSSKSSTPTTATTATSGNSSTGAAATGSPLLVGMVCSCSGQIAFYGNAYQRVFEGFENYINANGGIAGHPVKLVFKDDGGTPATSITDAHDLVADHVVALIDGSADDLAWETFVKSSGVPVLGTGAAEPYFTNSDFYSDAQTEDSLFGSVIQAGKTQGVNSIVELYCAESIICQQGIAPFRAAGNALGVKVPAFEEISATSPSYAAQCEASKQAKANGLYIAEALTAVVKVAEDCSQLGYHPVYLVDGENLAPDLATTPAINQDLAMNVPTIPITETTQPEVATMITALDKYEPGLVSNSSPDWNEVVAEIWPLGLLLQAAAEGGGLTASTTPTAAEIQTGLHSLHGDTLDGWSPPLTYKAGQANPIDCWFVALLKNGVFSYPIGNTVQCESGAS